MAVVPVDVVVVADVVIFIADTAATIVVVVVIVVVMVVVVIIVVANIIVIVVIVIVLPRLGFTCMLLISVLPENSHNLTNLCKGDISSKPYHISFLLFYLVVTCTALANPAHGSWDRDDCRANSQKCRSICLLRCDAVNGFQLEGPDTRECLATGQWSTPWNSYCKGAMYLIWL